MTIDQRGDDEDDRHHRIAPGAVFGPVARLASEHEQTVCHQGKEQPLGVDHARQELAIARRSLPARSPIPPASRLREQASGKLDERRSASQTPTRLSPSNSRRVVRSSMMPVSPPSDDSITSAAMMADPPRPATASAASAAIRVEVRTASRGSDREIQRRSTRCSRPSRYRHPPGAPSGSSAPA